MYKPSPNKGWHIIDLKAFEVSTPKSYKCIIREGVDFFAGELTDGNIRIFFGYGCHIDPSPRDKIDDIERNSDHINLISYSKYLHKILDVSKYSKEGEVNLTELFNDFQDLKLLAYSDTVKLSTPKPDSMEYYFSFIYDDIIYNIPFDYDQRVIENEKKYEFSRDTIQGIYFKKHYDRIKSDTMVYGIYMVDLSKFSDGMNAYCTKLGMRANKIPFNDFETIRTIMESIQFKDK
jgi:hypothetical protein